MSYGSLLRDCRNYAVYVHGMTKSTVLRLINRRNELAAPTSRHPSATPMLSFPLANVRFSRPRLIAAIMALGFALAAELPVGRASDDDLTLAPIVDEVPESDPASHVRLSLSDHILVPANTVNKTRLAPVAPRTEAQSSNRRTAPPLLSSESVANAQNLKEVEASQSAVEQPASDSTTLELLPTLNLKSFVKIAPVTAPSQFATQPSDSEIVPPAAGSVDAKQVEESADVTTAEPFTFERRAFLATVGERLERSAPPNDSSADAEDDPLVAQLLIALNCMAYVEPTPTSVESPTAESDHDQVAAATPESEPSATGISGFVKPATTAPLELVQKPRNPFQFLFVPAALAKPERPVPAIVATTDRVEPATETNVDVREQVEESIGTQQESLEPIAEQVAISEPQLVDFMDDATLSAAFVRLPGLDVPEAQPIIDPLLVSVMQPTTPPADGAEDVATPEPDGLKPIGLVSTRIAPESGDMPRDYATSRFAGAGEVQHSMGVSRETEAQFNFNWEAPALCHRALVFEEVNLERYGYKVPLVQPALSAAHFFGRVPLVPYLMAAEGGHRCTYTLGHYRPGDDAPYYWYVPPWQWKAGMIEAAAVAGVFFAFP